MSEELQRRGAGFPVYTKALSLLTSVGRKVPGLGKEGPGAGQMHCREGLEMGKLLLLVLEKYTEAISALDACA